MIGYYVHHQGLGHAHRAVSICDALTHEVTGLSTLPVPRHWQGRWLELDRDDEDPPHVDVTAGRQLHWAPLHNAGLRTRMAQISDWIRTAKPQLMIVDISVEVALLARLHGIPVVTVVLPGNREDPAHRLVHDLARRIIAVWPPEAAEMVKGLAVNDPRLACVGAISRYDRIIAGLTPRSQCKNRVTLLTGKGGNDVAISAVEHAQATTPGWEWSVLGEGFSWTDDPWEVLIKSDVVITHAGQNAIAEVAAARRPAIVFAQERPHQEQRSTVATLQRLQRLPVIAVDRFPADGWPERLAKATTLHGDTWKAWNDGEGAARAAAIIMEHLDG